MAVSFLAHEVSDLCLGKPALKSLPYSATVADALSFLKASAETSVSVWSCNHGAKAPGFNRDNEDGDAAGRNGDPCKCVGKISMVDVICYLCKEENLASPSSALRKRVSAILPRIPGCIVHVEPSCRLREAIDLMLEGAQNLVVPIKTKISTKRKLLQKCSPTITIHNNREFCWLTQEDVIRFLIGSIGLFSPMPSLSIDALGIITTTTVSAVNYRSPAFAALGAISRAHANQTSVAVVDGDGVLIGEISPSTLSCCDETVAAAITTLSSGDLMAYIDCGVCGGPPEDLVRLVMSRLKERGLNGALEHFSMSTNSSASLTSSSDEESSVLSPMSPLPRAGRYSRSMSYSARMMKRAEAIVCHPKSSLVAVMIQAIAHRVNYVWVVEEDCGLLGIVTFSNMLKVFKEHSEAIA